MMRIAILISGSGSNMISLCNSMLSEKFAMPVLVLSDRKAVKGLSAARELGIKTSCIEYSSFYDDHGGFEESLNKELLSAKPDLICLAGFLRILSKSFINNFPKKIINIHPSLLPKYKGLNTHSRALLSGDRLAGCTVHEVTPELDSGPILGQVSVPVLSNETAETLSKKVLTLEHLLYPIILRRLVS